MGEQGSDGGSQPVGMDGKPLVVRGYARLTIGRRAGRIARIKRIVWLSPANVPPTWRIEFDDDTQAMSTSVVATHPSSEGRADAR